MLRVGHGESSGTRGFPSVGGVEIIWVGDREGGREMRLRILMMMLVMVDDDDIDDDDIDDDDIDDNDMVVDARTLDWREVIGVSNLFFMMTELRQAGLSSVLVRMVQNGRGRVCYRNSKKRLHSKDTEDVMEWRYKYMDATSQLSLSVGCNHIAGQDKKREDQSGRGR